MTICGGIAIAFPVMPGGKVMKDPWATAALLGLAVFVAIATEARGDHALGTESQLAWRRQLIRVADALARGDLSGAELAWRDAYAAALKSRHWEGMVAVGDAYRVVGERGRFRKSAEVKARETYLTAFLRARAEASLEGVLRVADRFADLGDREVVEQCIRVARSIAAKGGDPRAHERVRAFTERWAARAQELAPRGYTEQ
jgi:hypothetical protein